MTIGETLADPDDPRPLPVITVDEPSLSIVVGINDSPLAGREGTKLTARQIRDRLDQELVGNVSIRVRDTERPDAWEVHGRGELQLVVLSELMRREGFELTASQPRVLTREVDGKLCEPVERLAIDVPEEYVGVVTQMLALRKGRMEQMVNHSTGWVRLDYLRPGARADRVSDRVPDRDPRHRPAPPRLRRAGSRGRASCGPARPAPWSPTARARPRASPCIGLQDRGSLFVGPGEDVYEGMIVGENSRADDLDVNATKQKHQTNVRAASADILVRLIPPRPLSLEQALEFLGDDESVEITPRSLRLRKTELAKTERVKTARRARADADADAAGS